MIYEVESSSPQSIPRVSMRVFIMFDRFLSNSIYSSSLSKIFITLPAVVALILFLFVLNITRQIVIKSPYEPPVVRYWIPLLGSALAYGRDPYAFFFRCRQLVRIFMSSGDTNFENCARVLV